MLPTFSHGDFVVVAKSLRKKLSRGDVVVIKSADFGLIIKRVETILADKTFTVTGDNISESTTLEQLGTFQSKELVGKVIYHIKG